MSERKLDLVLTGTGRCATRFYARYLTSAGIHCGHERFFSVGGLRAAEDILANHWFGTVAESSWLAAPFLDREPLQDAIIVHLVRHPKEVIESMVRCPPSSSPEYAKFAECHVPELIDLPPIDWAAGKWLWWNAMIERAQPDILFRVEREPKELLQELDKVGFTAPIVRGLFDNRKCNTKSGPQADVSLEDIDSVLGQQIKGKYGYQWPQ